MTNIASSIYSTTRSELRSIIAKLVLGKDGYFTGTTTSAGNAGGTTFVDSARLEPADYFNGFYSFLTVGTVTGEGRIQDFTSPTLTLATAFGAPTQIASGSAYELSRFFTVSDFNQAIKLAINDVNHLFLKPVEYHTEDAPSTACVAADSGVGGNPDGTYLYKITFVTSVGETIANSASNLITVVTNKINLTSIPTGSINVDSRKIYRTINGGTTYYLLDTISDNTTVTYLDNISDATLLLSSTLSNSDSTSLSLSTSTSEYNIPSAFSHIYAIEIEADTDDWYPITPGGWNIVRGTRKARIDLNVVNSYPSRAIRYLGLIPHPSPSSDSEAIYIDPNFVTFKAASLLCLEKSSGFENNSGWIQKAQIFEQRAQEIKNNFRASIPNNTRKVGY